MSEHTATTSSRATRASGALPASANGQDNANTVTIEIGGHDVTLPIRFSAGQVLTENQAKVLDAAYQRQFTNNQNAMQKARKEATPPKALLTATELAVLYTDYEPNVGGTRMGSMEKIKNDAAWRMWTALVAAHNTSVANGNAPVIAKAGTKQVPGLKPVRGADGKVIVTVPEQRERLTARILTMPEYAAAVQEQVDIILAERGASKDTVADTDNTVSINSLFD